MKKIISLLAISLSLSAGAQTLYFPPLSNTAPWDTISPASLGWCADEIDSLYSYLDGQNSKAFIVLKDGRIVLEKYFGTFTADSAWYWASAGKTITSFLTGKAQEEGFLSLSDPTNSHIGAGWTIATAAQENAITIRHQLTMTSGLDDGVPDHHCTIDTCLQYLAPAGSRWAYHNAPYTLLDDVLTSATGSSLNTYTQTKLKNKTGMTGSWIVSGYNNVFISRARSMARFGLLIQNDCIWDNDTLLHDTAYISQMTNTSQPLNESYGYLWWLNGKPSYMVPMLSTPLTGSLSPNAPSDMFSAVGKNGQFVSISKSTGLVVVRMGNAPTDSEVPFLMLDEIWAKLNAVMCTSTNVSEREAEKISVYPNPANDQLHIRSATAIEDASVYDLTGRLILHSLDTQILDVSSLPAGIYVVGVKAGGQRLRTRFVKR
jgi:CubicO group peptidase (beta-lactamase class C family)